MIAWILLSSTMRRMTRMVDDNKIHAIMQANAAKKSKGKKSKFQQRYEELMRQQEAQQRAKRK